MIMSNQKRVIIINIKIQYIYNEHLTQHKFLQPYTVRLCGYKSANYTKANNLKSKHWKAMTVTSFIQIRTSGWKILNLLSPS